jgi:hypothetical protein
LPPLQLRQLIKEPIVPAGMQPWRAGADAEWRRKIAS